MGQRGMLGLKDWCWDYDSTSLMLVVGCELRKEVCISQLGVLCSNTNGICGFEAQHEAKPEWSEILQQFSFSFRRVLSLSLCFTYASHRSLLYRPGAGRAELKQPIVPPFKTFCPPLSQSSVNLIQNSSHSQNLTKSVKNPKC